MENKTKRDGQYVKEWEFSFEDLNHKITDFVKSISDSSTEALKTDHFNEPLGGTTSARIRLDMPVCEALITTAAPDQLIEAEITHIGEIKFAVTGEAEKVIHVSQETQPSDWARNMFGWIGTNGK